MTAAREVDQPLILPKTLNGVNIEFKTERRMTEAEFMEFCAENDHLRIEQDKNGKLIIMPPVDYDGGAREGIAYGYLFNWWLSFQKGRVFSPSTGFRLPDSSVRASDGCWISDERMSQVVPGDRKKFARVVPDFVIEVRSDSDRIGVLRKKMADTWIANGVRLGWLIDPLQEKAYVYRQDGSSEIFNGFDYILSGENVCPGLTFDLSKMRI
jgi:Uma2 family endonuclease